MNKDAPVALITGAGAGFGRELARSFAADGTRVVVTDIDLGAAQVLADELKRSDRVALPVQVDVADIESMERAVREVEEVFGRLDVLVNNAGRHLTTYSRPFSELSPDQLRGCVDVNVMGVVYGTLACRPLMAKSGGGSVVNLSSIAAYEVVSIYGVTKLAVRGLTTAFAHELAADGIRVNAVAPGLMATEAALADLGDEVYDDFVNGRQLVKRRGEMKDVVDTIRFLCSPEASFITGETIKVSGGYPLLL
ncbi:SDR family oxidoreductase [Dactylosporangium sp. NPDC005572]|uniref:SDR family NAD(P)-dependent oxidoreductase n=1 Tax=Dactylosporangium sp. NPDC005572 TaxID=3156889 RepID=UPI0033B14C04